MRYIGCKTKLLQNIDDAIVEFCPKARVVCDIFSGTASVARHLKTKYEIISNDILYFSYILQAATIENDETPVFSGLSSIGIDDPVSFFNYTTLPEMESLEQSRRFFQNTFSPVGGRKYFTEENALRIDFSRNTVEEWKECGLLSQNEYCYLLACIIEGIPFVSNIAGTYGAFNKFWDKRSSKKYELFSLSVYSNGKNNKCFNEDGVELLKRIEGDVLYVDPPYNGRQYISNYHVLETAALYDFPRVKGVTAQRVDDEKRSLFCQKRTVLEEFEKLIRNANFPHIILSYNTEGLMSVEQIQEVMETYGKAGTFKAIEIPYRRFKSRSTNHNGEIKELLIHIEKSV